jgi:hypothetical protein
VSKGNFFRSLLAWPLSAVFSPVGNILLIPSIVQAKIWSEVVAAIIEGAGKFRRTSVLVSRDLREILPRIESDKKDVVLTAMLDLLYVWAKQPRGRTALKRLISSRKTRFSLRSSPNKTEQPIEVEGERETDPESSFLIDRLVQIYKPLTAQSKLSEFIAGKYTVDEGLVLSEIIYTHLVPFYLWLSRLQTSDRK